MKKKKYEKRQYDSVDKYLTDYFNARKRFMHEKEEEAGVPLTSKTDFIFRVKARISETTGKNISDVTLEEAKLSARQTLNTNLYKTYAERTHKVVTDILKETGLTSKLYRMGGKTSFDASKFIRQEIYTIENGKEYQAKGKYIFGGVTVIIWSPKGGNYQTPGFVELIDSNGNFVLRTRKHN